MPDLLKVAVSTTATTPERAREVLSDMLDALFEDYELGFRSHGGVRHLIFDGRECRGERRLDETVASVADLDRARLSDLTARYPWVTVTGTIGIPEVARALNVCLFLYPTFIPERSVCAVAWLDAWLYETLWDDEDRLNEAAAERLRALIVALGANARVQGFHTARLDAFADLVTFDAETLRDSLLHPTSVAAARRGEGLVHALVTGISHTLLTSRDLEGHWGDFNLSETLNGFTIVDGLVEIPDEDADLEDD